MWLAHGESRRNHEGATAESEGTRVAPVRFMLLLRVLLVWVSCVAPCAATAAELERETVIAYERYIEQLARAFALEAGGGEFGLEHISPQALARLRRGETLARAGHEDGILDVSGGLIHHWRSAVFIPDVSLELVLATAQDYGSYAGVYDWVIRSRLLRHVKEHAAQRDRFWTFLRIERSASVVTSTVDLWTETEYRYLRHDLATAISNADCIRQVEDPGERDEQRLEVGRGSGYLWRADTYASYLERDGGVYIDLQTVGLSRGFPPLLGWVIEPIARRLGRGSAEDSLKQLREAVVRAVSRPHEPSKSPEAVEPSSSLSPTGWCGEPAQGPTTSGTCEAVAGPDAASRRSTGRGTVALWDNSP